MHTLKFRPPKVFQNLFPIWWIIISAEIRLQLSAEDLQRGALANTVCSNKTQHLPRPRHRQPMQFETIGRVSMGDLGFEICRQVYDVDRPKRAFFNANTTADAKTLGDEGNF